MQSRIANPLMMETISARDAYVGTAIVCNDNQGDAHVSEITRHRNGTVTLQVWRQADGVRVWTVPADRELRVRSEYACDCRGSGTYSWGGSVNGRPVKTGPHFACAEKGYQTRADLIRNSTYWNKYAKIWA